MELLHDCYEIASRMFSEHLHQIFLDYNYWSYNGINTQTPSTFAQMDLSCATRWLCTQKQFSVKCLLQRKLFSFGTKPSCAKVENI